MRAYYNEIDPFAAQWLRELIKAGLITDGVVDERSIAEVEVSDLVGFDRVHLFAGIGGWEYALRLADWGEQPVWTGSCPCQPFSEAGAREGFDDERHLWPEMFRLISKCRPDVVFGEQVSGAIRHGWLDGIYADLENAGYAVGAVVCGAHSVAAPHIRQRLYWVAESVRAGIGVEGVERHTGIGRNRPANDGAVDGLADSRRLDGSRGGYCGTGKLEAHQRGESFVNIESSGVDDGLGNTIGAGSQGLPGSSDTFDEPGRIGAGSVGPVPAPSAWAAYSNAPCRDERTRRIGCGVQPLAYGIPRKLGSGFPLLQVMAADARENRIGRLKGYGNAIVPQLAAEFIRAWKEFVNP